MRRAVIAVAIAALGLATPAPAQTYPDRLIRMIVPFPPGGPVDVMARIVAQALAADPRPARRHREPRRRLRRDRRQGRRRSRPDGYTLLCGNISSLVVTPVVNQQPRLRSGQDLHRRRQASQNYEVLVVHPNFPAKIGAGARRLRQGQSRQAQLRLAPASATPAISPPSCSSSGPASTSSTCHTRARPKP